MEIGVVGRFGEKKKYIEIYIKVFEVCERFTFDYVSYPIISLSSII